MSNPRETLRFGDFELDVAGYELRRSGRPIRLERQPMDLLIMLVARRGELVSRDDIVGRLWSKDVFVDVDTGVHTAIRKIRRALNDSPDEPKFVETVSGKGYRFIAPVEVVTPAVDPMPARTPEPPQATGTEETAGVSPPPRTSNYRYIVMGLAVATIAIASITWTMTRRETPPSRVTIAVLPFESASVDPDRAYLAEGLTEEITAWLG